MIKNINPIFNKYCYTLISSNLITFFLAINHGCTNTSTTIITTQRPTPKAKLTWLFHAASLYVIMLFFECHKMHQLVATDPRLQQIH